MKIDALIEKLEVLKEEHGNLDICEDRQLKMP